MDAPGLSRWPAPQVLGCNGPRQIACIGRKKVNLGRAFAGQNVGVKEEEDSIWLVSFMPYDIGYFELESCRVEPVENPLGPKVLTVSSA